MTGRSSDERDDDREGRGYHLPFVPRHASGTLLEKGEERFILWHEDGVVEEAEASSASVGGIETLQKDVLALLRMGVRQPARLVEALVELGYADVGMRRFNFLSGSLYQYARTQLALSQEAAAQRQTILDANGGQHPALDSPDWRPWHEAAMTMNSFALGARLLGTAALEALTNEILAVSFPAVYERVETGRRPWGFFAKLRELCHNVGISEDPPWLEQLEKRSSLRRGIAHHRPGYIDDLRPPDSVEPSPVNSPEEATQFLSLIDEAFEAIFAAFGLQVPVTHVWDPE